MSYSNSIYSQRACNVNAALKVSGKRVRNNYDWVGRHFVFRLILDCEPSQLPPLVSVESQSFDINIGSSADRKLRDTLSHLCNTQAVFIKESHVFQLNWLCTRGVADIRNDEGNALVCLDPCVSEESEFSDHDACGNLNHFSTRSKRLIHAHLRLRASDWL